MVGEKMFLFTDQELKIPNICRDKDGKTYISKGRIEREFKYSHVNVKNDRLYGHVHPYNNINLTYAFIIDTLPFTDVKRLVDKPYELFLKAMCKHIADNKRIIAKRDIPYGCYFTVELTNLSEITITDNKTNKKYVYVYSRPLLEIYNIIIYLRYLCKNNKELNEPVVNNPRLNCLLYYIQGYWLGKGFKPIENLMISIGKDYKVYSFDNVFADFKPYEPMMSRKLKQHIREVVDLMGIYTTEHLENKISSELYIMGYDKEDKYIDLGTEKMKKFFSKFVED